MYHGKSNDLSIRRGGGAGKRRSGQAVLRKDWRIQHLLRTSHQTILQRAHEREKVKVDREIERNQHRILGRHVDLRLGPMSLAEQLNGLFAKRVSLPIRGGGPVCM